MSDQQPSNDRRALLQQALQSLDAMQAKLDTIEHKLTEPIAIIGMGCRFPGDANTPDEYWRLLSEGVDAVGFLSPERQALIGGFDHLPDDFAMQGGFLRGIEGFDPQLFGISPREATTMDPQQRLVLEVSWEALERAGIAPDRLMGSATGVFVGISTNDYGQLLRLDPSGLDVYAATGGALNTAPGRLSYQLGLNGPALAIDTACSSSLVAVHLAARSLRSGECDMALAGGVNITLMPEAFVCFTAWGMLAADGRCKAFDAAADGFVRGEGCGMIVLKRLSDAQADGDNILALIRGSAVNQDGRSAGLTVPSGSAQRAVIEAALSNAGARPADVQYVEAHGTGTSLGDPIEVEAIGAAYGPGRAEDQPLYLGSVKTNLGHLESAAGVAGLIKLVLILQHGQVPPHLHLQERNPAIPWPSFPIEIPVELGPWSTGDGPRLAGISGFGISGTNAHVILGPAPTAQVNGTTSSHSQHLLPLSARDASSLQDLADRYANHLRAHPELDLADVVATAAGGRAQLPHRLGVTAVTLEEAADKLASFAEGQTAAGAMTGVVPVTARPRPVFQFTGQGSQYAGMGRELYDTSPVFRTALDRCAEILQPLLDVPLLELLFAEPESPQATLLDQTTYTQPALFALEYALAELWISWGIRPAAVAGHSLGEYVAACVAGVFSLEEALRLVATRGQLMGSLSSGGAMAAVFASIEQVTETLAVLDVDVSIAANNGPTHTVISGSGPDVAVVTESLTEQGFRVRALQVSHAFHSALMDPILDAFEEVARGVTYQSPRIPVVSNLTGELWTEGWAPDANYWREQLRSAVQYRPMVESLHAAGYELFLEVGPHPVLSGMGQECVPPGSGTWLASLRRGRGDWDTLLANLAQLYVVGGAIDWDAVNAPYASRRLDLPTYPFQHERYWTNATYSQGTRVNPNLHPLLGRGTRSPFMSATLYESAVSSSQPAYLGDHRVYGATVFPGSAFIELALAAAAGQGDGTLSVDHLELQAPFVLPADGSERLLHVALEPEQSSGHALRIASLPADGDTAEAVIHATGSVNASQPNRTGTAGDLASINLETNEEIDIGGYYERLANIELDYGPAFRGLAQLRQGVDMAVGLIKLPAGTESSPHYQIHPALLDTCFHVVGVAVSDTLQDEDVPFVPAEIDGLHLYRKAGNEIWCVARVDSTANTGDGSLAVRIELYDLDGAPIADIERLTLRRVARAAWSAMQSDQLDDWFYRIAWQPVAESEPVLGDEAGTWLILADSAGFGCELAAEFTALGATSILVSAGDSGITLDARDPDGARRLLRDLPANETLQGIIDLRALDQPDDLLGDPTLTGALHLAQALAGEDRSAERLWFLTRGAVAVESDPAAVHAPSAALWGMGRTLANEQPNMQCSLLDLDPIAPTDTARLAAFLLQAGDENQVAWRGDRSYVARLERFTPGATTLPDRPYQLRITERGAIENLSLDTAERRDPGEGEVEIAVRASGLNFRDVLNVLGMYPGEPGPPGSECSGTITRIGPGVDHLRPGDEVVALGSGLFASHVIVPARLALPKPAELSFAEAAAVPNPYLAAGYGLINLADLQPGESVLIHAAAGGVGLAAVQIALSKGAEVFATAGSPAKRSFLAELGVRHIYSSRTLDFADEIMDITGGNGVDVILNSLAGDFIEKSFEVLAPNGRFLELGKRDVWSPERVARAKPEAAYHVYDLGEVLQNQPGVLEDLLDEMLQAIAAGRMKMIPVRSFPASATVDAFRHMAQARHIGKIVIVQQPDDVPVCRPDSSYLITGGMGGLGLELAGWLVENGAEAIALLGRREPSTEVRERIAELEVAGARVLTLQGDVSNLADMNDALAIIDSELPPLRGVYHAAGTVDDGELSQLTVDRFNGVLAGKAVGALHLDRLTRRYDLDQFVMFSSASAVLGSAGQSSYSAANAVLDGLAHARRAEGLTGLSINWGAWDTVGMAAALESTHRRRIADMGMGTIDPARGLRALAMALCCDSPQLAIMPVRWKQLARHVDPDREPPLLVDILATLTRTSNLPTQAVYEQVANASPEERADLTLAYLRDTVSAVLGLDPLRLDLDQPLTELGIDSLMAVEVRNRISAGLRVMLNPVDVLDGASTRVLALRALSLVEDTSPEPDATSNGTSSTEPVDVMVDIDRLSDEQVEELLRMIAAED